MEEVFVFGTFSDIEAATLQSADAAAAPAPAGTAPAEAATEHDGAAVDVAAGDRQSEPPPAPVLDDAACEEAVRRASHCAIRKLGVEQCLPSLRRVPHGAHSLPPAPVADPCVLRLQAGGEQPWPHVLSQLRLAGADVQPLGLRVRGSAESGGGSAVRRTIPHPLPAAAC